MHVCVGGHTGHGACVKTRGHFREWVLPLCVPWETNSGPRALQQVPLLAESLADPSTSFFEVGSFINL